MQFCFIGGVWGGLGGVWGGSENQSVSGVTTICLTQCNTSPSHRVDQVVDCGLWNCKTVKSEPKTDSDQAEGCRNNLSFWRGWKGNMKYLITLWKAKISVPPYLPLSTGLTDPDSPQSESDSINKCRSYNLSLSMCGPQGDYTGLFL